MVFTLSTTAVDGPAFEKSEYPQIRRINPSAFLTARYFIDNGILDDYQGSAARIDRSYLSLSPALMPMVN